MHTVPAQGPLSRPQVIDLPFMAFFLNYVRPDDRLVVALVAALAAALSSLALRVG
jgi:hypothetical protein